VIRRRPIPKVHEMTLLDGTVVREGDKVYAIGGGGGRPRVCKVLEILKGCGVDKAILTAPDPFGTVIRTRYQIKRHEKP
jgi:hypothetical protein